MSPSDLESALTYLKALADESRLKILGILSGREASVEELSALLSLKAPTVSHHLGRLKEAGLVGMRPDGNTHMYSLRVEALRDLNKTLLAPEKMAALVGDLPEQAWERKVLRDFFEGERLKEIPASRKKREVVLRWLAGQFNPGRRYPEAEVNEILKRHHPDFATLRREFIGNRLMEREGGVYWRL